MIALDIKDYTTDAGNRQNTDDRISKHCILAASRSARPPPRGYTGHVAVPHCSILAAAFMAVKSDT
jgi:hypothetical protein